MQFAFFTACALLLLGFALLSKFKLLQSLYVPASVIAGAIAFALIQLAHRYPQLHSYTTVLIDEYRAWPSWLIAVVFAAMLLERPATSFRESLRRTASEGITVWVIILGQLVVGLLVTWLFLRPVFGVPIAFGQLLEVSWAGGFGSATAWGTIYKDVPGFPAAQDLGVLFAATGLLYGVISGLFFVNVALRRKWTARLFTSADSIVAAPPQPSHPPMAYARVRREMVDPFVFQGLILATAFLCGIGLQFSFNFIAGRFNIHVDLPLFLFTLLGGLITRELMHLVGVGHLIDPPSLHRLSGAAMEFLIISAIAAMRLDALVNFGMPALILIAVGAAWSVVCLLWLSPLLLSRRYWFELGLINHEMATATTAQGLMLLRIVDPDLETGAAEDYGMAAPLSAPFIGGGIITLSLPLLFQRFSVASIIIACAIAASLLFILGRRLQRAP